VSGLTELSARWNALDAELDALWEREGKPQRGRWENLAAPLWARQESIESELAPLLLAWCKANELVDPWGYATDYKKIRQHAGIKANGHIIGRLLRGALQEEARQSLDKLTRSMPQAEWDGMMEGFCTLTPEGQNTKDYLQRARATRFSGGSSA
jgi:hypothetical protein